MSTSVVAEALAATVIAPAAWGGVPTMRALPACSTRTGRRSFGSAHALEPVLRTLTVAIRWPAAPSQAVISALRSAAAQASTEPGTDVGVASGPTAAVLWVGPGPFRPPAASTAPSAVARTAPARTTPRRAVDDIEPNRRPASVRRRAPAAAAAAIAVA